MILTKIRECITVLITLLALARQLHGPEIVSVPPLMAPFRCVYNCAHIAVFMDPHLWSVRDGTLWNATARKDHRTLAVLVAQLICHTIMVSTWVYGEWVILMFTLQPYRASFRPDSSAGNSHTVQDSFQIIC